MQSRFTNKLRRGLATTEVVVSVTLLMLLAGLLAKTLFDYRHTRDHYIWRQAAAWAADAQLQRYQAGAPIDSLPPAGIIPEQISLKTEAEPGTGQWQGLNRVTVIAAATLPTNKRVDEQISGYVQPEAKP